MESTGNGYKRQLWQHLSEYKQNVLGVSENGIWRANGLSYGHILPFAQQKLNILEPYRDEFWDWFRTSGIKLHSDFHHLSSSQAMCFNLFFPFIAEQKKFIAVLREVFSTNGDVKDGKFEVVLNDVEGTNFDFCIFADSRKLFEVKLTEEGFGTAKPDESHLLKYKGVYQSSLNGKFKPEFCSSSVFLRNYQLMRNVWNLGQDTKDELVCLVPKANTCLEAGLIFLDSCLSNAYRPRVSVMFLDDVLPRIERTIPTTATRMREHFRLFHQKYLLTVIPDRRESAEDSNSAE